MHTHTRHAHAKRKTIDGDVMIHGKENWQVGGWGTSWKGGGGGGGALGGKAGQDKMHKNAVKLCARLPAQHCLQVCPAFSQCSMGQTSDDVNAVA